ncbi:serine O-acetyltransferase (plasmid) [Tundrisphaera lichenicola]|uniref:serine O-acetyltransferase n=1 Tax=Tundrisphaera lichenicola TaxID=2029860 RepID=UPI003EBE864D
MTSAADGTIAPPNAEPTELNRGDRNLNPPGISFLGLLREDLANHGGTIFEQGFWAVAVHRFGNWRMDRPKLIRAPLTILYRLMYLFVECAAGISLPYTIRLGRRVRIWHHSGIILHARSIGDDVHIRQNTTMGIANMDRHLDLPIIGNRVDIGCGVCILGAVTLGDDCKIGANAVVLSDIPAGSTAVGMPARVVRRSSPGGPS